VEAQHGNAEAILHFRIELGVRELVRDHLAAAGEADGRAEVAAVLVLEIDTVAAARRIAVDAAHESCAGLAETAPDFDVVAAREVEAAVVEPPWHVDVSAADAFLVMHDVI